MDKEVEAATSVDVLIERLATHPDEFFNKHAVVTYDGDKIFAGTKWRRIVVTLMVDAAPGEANLWMNLFTGPEKDRFRTAMYAALRSELDAQIMMALMKGTAMPRTEEEEKAWYQAQMGQTQMATYSRGQAAQGAIAGGSSILAQAMNTQKASHGNFLTDWLNRCNP